MDTLREKSKKLLRQAQIDTDVALKAKLLGTGGLDIVQDYKTIVDICSLTISEDILKITNKLERLVSNQSLRPEVRKELLDIIAMLA